MFLKDFLLSFSFEYINEKIVSGYIQKWSRNQNTNWI